MIVSSVAQTNAIPIASRSPLTVRRVMSLSDISWSNFGPYSHPSHGDPLSPHSVPQSYYSDAAPLALQLSQFTTLLSRGNLNPAIMELSPEEMERFQKLSNEYEPDIQVRSSVLSIGPRTHRPWDNRDLLSRRNSKARISPSNMLTPILPLLRKPEYVVGHVTLFFFCSSEVSDVDRPLPSHILTPGL